MPRDGSGCSVKPRSGKTSVPPASKKMVASDTGAPVGSELRPMCRSSNWEGSHRWETKMRRRAESAQLRRPIYAALPFLRTGLRDGVLA